MRLRSASDCGVEEERTSLSSVFRISASREIGAATRGIIQAYQKFFLI
jgi:hypothetical protein